MKLLKDWFTGPNNDNFELSRALWFAGFMLALGCQGYAVYRSGEFDIVTFGQGVGILLLAGAGGTGLKDFAASRSKV